jgi:tetratricopeptide (TPR) repeat protein
LDQTQDPVARADAALTKLQTALAEDRIDEAVAWAKEAVGAAPRYTRAIYGLATVLKRAGKHAEARRVLNDAPPDLAGTTGDLVEIATFCLREGVQDSAKEILRRALEADPKRERVAEVLTGVYLSERDAAAAIAVCEPFRARGASTPLLLRLQAAAYEQLGDLPSAMDCARMYGRVAPLDPRGHYHLGSLEHRMGNIPEAMERYELAFDLDGGNSEVAAAASDGIRALDAIQLRQITALAATDQGFRVALGRDMREALDARGFVLSDEGYAILSNIDLDMIARDARGGGYDYH